ncbi:MAG: non-homologous end-joining DNA ligase [Verrucomicrobia bacterium]|nr:non-homologous end-joining DNA ligase [Verrucomicrobiota bacterium]MDE3047905.1 non-homologous end-joining DNA ligase [Verrucomicrobiota bacterium]
MKSLSPMLCTLVDEPFDEKGWIFEIKWDGYRAFAKKNGSVQLISRGKKSYNQRFPTLVAELSKMRGSFILDGEIVILDKKGKSNFQMLQNYYTSKVGTPYFYVFDILSLNGRDLKRLPLLERKKILKKVLPRMRHVRFSKHLLTHGKALFRLAEKKGLEGIVAKKGDSAYQFARTRNWLKIKTKNRQEVVIGGFTAPKGSRKRFGALLIGVYRQGKLEYAGRVGGGFNEKLLGDVYAALQKVISLQCPFKIVPTPHASVTWVKPTLVCEVEFTEWTKEGKLRHPIFKGMRYDKSAKRVVRE